MTPEEQTLVDGCRAGDERAWLAVYRAYAADVGMYLRGVLLHSQEVDDLVQRVFLEFLGSLDRFRGEAGLRTWLHRIARHVAMREMRTRQRREQHIRAYARAVQDDRADGEARAHARLRLQQVEQLLSDLDPDFREVWVLRELSQLSVAETAAIVDIPAGTVRTRHHRARQRLFELLRNADASGSPRATLMLVSGGGEGAG